MEKEKPVGLIDSLKMKIIEVGVDYVKKNIENSKKEFVKYVEKQLEKKIKKEIKKTSFRIVSYLILLIGSIFLLYGISSLISYLLGLPGFATNIFFGLFLITIGLIIWLIYR